MENIKFQPHQFRDMNTDEQEEIKSNFLINSLSFSKVRSFHRNRLNFEYRYIYNEHNERAKVGLVVGRGLHAMLEYYFKNYSEKTKEEKARIGIEELSKIGWTEIEKVKEWAKMKTPKEEMKLQCEKQITNLAKFFLQESFVYTDLIQETFLMESFLSQFITLSGQDIPLPFGAMIDMPAINKEGELIIIDHKKVSQYTNYMETECDEKTFSKNEKEMNALATSIGTSEYAFQGIIYTKIIESMISRGEIDQELLKKYPKIREGVKKVYFFEFKSSVNIKPPRPQINMVEIEMNQNTRTLFEYMFYGRTKDLLMAVSDPNYSYYMNTDDAFLGTQEKVELTEFELKKATQEVEDFEFIKPEIREKLEKRKKKINQLDIKKIDAKVLNKFAKNAKNFITYDNMNDKTPEGKICSRLRSHAINVKVDNKIEGLSADVYLIEMGIGHRPGMIKVFAEDIASCLGVEKIRVLENNYIKDGQAYKAIEVPKADRIFVDFDEKLVKKGVAKIPIGKTNFNEVIYWDLESPSSPHLLGGGQTGAGKSFFIKVLLKSVKKIGGIKIIVFDQKRGLKEICGENNIEYLTELEDIELRMQELVNEMEKRYKNGKIDEKSEERILIIFDEMNASLLECESQEKKDKKLEKIKTKLQNAEDKVVISKNPEILRLWEKRRDEFKKELKIEKGRPDSLVFNNLKLVQKGRACGFNVVGFGQRLDASVIDGKAKANFGARISFKTSSPIDAKITMGIDRTGAENLTGKGDALFLTPDLSEPARIQVFKVE